MPAIMVCANLLHSTDGKAPDPNDRDNLGRTAMHLAAWAGHAVVVRRLAEAKGDPSARAGVVPLTKFRLSRTDF
jgi:ankyrin repeat protein